MILKDSEKKESSYVQKILFKKLQEKSLWKLPSLSVSSEKRKKSIDWKSIVLSTERKTQKSTKEIKIQTDALVAYEKAIENYDKEYVQYREQLLNQFCVLHKKKKGKYILKTPNEILLLVCSDCAVKLSYNKFKLEKINLDSKEQREEQIQEFIDNLINVQNWLQQQQTSINQSLGSSQDFLQNQELHIDWIIEGVEICINEINQQFVSKIQDNIKINIESLHSIQKQVQVNDELTQKIKNDLIDNFHQIKEELNEKDYKQIYSYYQEKLQEIILQNQESNLIIDKINRQKNIPPILEEFKLKYQEFLQTNFLL